MAAALFLAHRRVPVRIVDTAMQPASTSKALAVNSRTLEVLQGTGVAEQILAEGWAVRGATLHEGGRGGYYNTVTGAKDVLCTDKTGTLTQDKIFLARHVFAQGRDQRFERPFVGVHAAGGNPARRPTSAKAALRVASEALVPVR